ncbi:hypothetical protein, partial [uncultured Desulfovibrio sp.]|uniref:hypothetical protein n=1 Tax=uncultured Desulfovibrio sp. TaxID=167968 RepID=UPI00261F848E
VTGRFLSVMYVSTLPPKIAHFLASAKKSYFLGSLRRQPRPKRSQGRPAEKHLSLVEKTITEFNEV